MHQWIEDQLKDITEIKEKAYDLYDQIFLNEMNRSIIEANAAYDALKYREALKYGFYNM